MPKKQEKKKKAFQAMCRGKVKTGVINRADGSWGPDNSRMGEMMRAGYRLG